MTDYVIAVPTYKRADHFQRNTLQVLRDHGLVDRLFVFVGSDLAEYKALEPDLRYVSVPVGKHRAVKAICEYFPVGQAILFMDDDLSDYCMYDASSDGFIRTGLADVIAEGFAHAPFSFGFLRNRLWLRKSPRLRPQYGLMAGGFFGVFNQPELITTTHASLDDTLRTIQYLKAGIVPWTFPGASFKTYYGKTPGGLQASGDRADTRKVCEEVADQVQPFCSEMVLHPEGLWAWKWKPAATVRRLFKANLSTH